MPVLVGRVENKEMKSQDERLRQIKERDERIKKNLVKIHHKIVIFSGKGGVGKTTVACNLSYALIKDGFKVGLLDADITGPNIPKMIGLEGRQPLANSEEEIMPLDKDGLKIISIASLIPSNTPVIWRGPLRSTALSQFLGDVVWGELDFLIADLPPGTGDEVLTTAQKMQPDMAIIVTTPQEMALIDSRRAVNMAKQLHINHIGIVENMSGLICPKCGYEIELFGKGGGKREAEELGVLYLGNIPINLEVRKKADEGIPIILDNEREDISQKIKKIAKKIEEILG